jgi:apolipoprotein N-acyltransferase
MEDGGSGEKAVILILLLLHLLWLLPTVPAAKGSAAAKLRRLRRGSELLLVPSLIFFLFAIIYAANANMTYAQWFAETSGNLHLAPDSAIQRLNALLRFGPLLLIDLVSYFAVRLGFLNPRGPDGNRGLIGTWQVLMALLSAVAVSLAFPSPVFPGGCALLAYLAPVPLLLVLSEASFPGALFSGVAYGTLQALLGNYWLGTYDLLTLHFVTFFHAAIFILFIPVLLMLSRSLPGLHGRRLRLPLIALLWVAFDFIRSGGFLGYPWGILGSSQYKVLPVIQSASVFGIWGVNLFVWLTAALITGILLRKNRGEAFRGELLGLSFLVGMVMMSGALQLRHWEALPPENHIDVALIQQNTDPRKNDYEETLGVLKKLSLEAAAQFGEGPDLVAWSETAFVPNLRKWGAMDPEEHPNAALAHDFLAFQRELGVWLLTGNDDYEEPDPDDPDDEGRKHYNAAVLFSDRGERIATYRKQHLVPFSESFPYEQEFPFIYKLLLAFDSTFWAAGDTPVVFHHPSADFITPICFEDSFPGEIADQVNLGVDLILNISNDFWSLTETEGEQHGANSIFRAVESRRPLLRSTASGLTCVVSPSGRILDQLPHYEEGFITARVNLYGRRDTFYLRHTDLLPKAIIGLALLLFLHVLRGIVLRGRKEKT